MTTSARRPLTAAPLVVMAALVIAAVASQWATLRELAAFWWLNEDYSVGMLIPAAWVWLIWRARDRLDPREVRPSWLGLVALLACQALRFGALIYGSDSVERYAFVLTIPSLTLLVFGPRVLMRFFWEHAFLLLLVPLPARIHTAIAMPLQSQATAIGHFGLELLGYFVARTGNVLVVNDRTTVMVAEACSGLRMLTAFVFVAAMLCFFVNRPTWQRVLLMGACVPTAVLMNGVRVVATSMFFDAYASESARKAFHDAAGVLMMPLAIGVLLGLLYLVDRVIEPPPPSRGSGRVAAAGRTVGRQPATES